jgi:hypothetical protein
MKWKLNKFGCLEIERNGIFIKQYCIYTNGKKCGDLCPLFDEPNPTSALDVEICCGKKFKIYNFIDERNYSKDTPGKYEKSEKLNELLKECKNYLKDIYD